MKRVTISIITVALMSAAVFLFDTSSIAKPLSNKGITLIELFTSEGCSSCPAADKIVADIQSTYGDDVLVLCYHVDYWNYLGWNDIYSSSENTGRQSYYTKIFSLDGAYTPQAVINGNEQCVGSDKGKLLHAIHNSSMQNSTSLKIAAIKKNNIIETNYSNNDLSKDEQILLCLVQKQATTQVHKGENTGRTLNHINIVRTFATKTVNKGLALLKIPNNYSQSNFFIVGFIQNTKSGTVRGISRTNID